MIYCPTHDRHHLVGERCVIEAPAQPIIHPPRTLTLSGEVLITLRVALQRHHNWLEDKRQRAITVNEPGMVRQAEIWIRQNLEALNELET